MGLTFWRKTQDTGKAGLDHSQDVTEATPLPVRLYPSDDDEPQRVQVNINPNAPLVYNKTLTTANTEYSQVIPNNAKRIGFQCRSADAVRFAWEGGHVAASVAPYETVKAGGYYDSGSIDHNGATLFLASGTAAVVVEIEVWI